MDRRAFLSAGTLALGSMLSPTWAEEDSNAAPHYRKAALLLPKLTEAEKEFIQSLPAVPLNAMGWDLIKRSEPVLRELTRGAELRDCDWGVDYIAKFFDSGTFPIVMQIRELARLVSLRACYSFQQKESLAAITDLGTTLKMARHVGRRGPFITTLVQIAIEQSTIDVAAAYLPRQNAKTLKALAACFEAGPRASPFTGALEGEKEFLLQNLRLQYQDKSSKEAFKLLQKDFSSDEEAKAILKATGGDVKGILKLIDRTAAFYDELITISPLPRAEFQKALSTLQKHTSDNPFAASILPVVEQIRGASDRVEVRFVMLQAAIKVVLSGTEQLKTIKDPFGNGPFKYRAFGGGFELESGLQSKDRPPVRVTVGLKPKE